MNGVGAVRGVAYCAGSDATFRAEGGVMYRGGDEE